jgi:hypothetical protein
MFGRECLEGTLRSGKSAGILMIDYEPFQISEELMNTRIFGRYIRPCNRDQEKHGQLALA